MAEPLPGGVASALFVNVLTEDNLPFYFASIEQISSAATAPGATGPGDGQPRRGGTRSSWRDYLMMSGHLDPVTLERARMVQVTGGVSPQAAVSQMRSSISPSRSWPPGSPTTTRARRYPTRGLRGHEAGGGR